MKKRVEFVDVLRGVSIILMIMGHLGFGYYFDYYIHAFHMPIWFFLAGYFQSNYKLNICFIKQKARKLIIPYLFWGLFQYPIWLLFNHNANDKFEPLINLFWINTNLVMPVAGALWFLTCLFFAELLFLFMQKCILHSVSKIFFLIVMISLGYLFPTFFHIRLPWAIDVALISLGLISLGYLIKIYYQNSTIYRIFNLSFGKSIIVGIFNVIGIFCNGYVNLRTGEYSCFTFFWINSVIAIITLWNLSRIIYIKFNEKIIIKELRFIGRNSLIYLVLNQLFVLIINMTINHIEITNLVVIYTLRLVGLVVIVIILHYISLFLNNKKIAWVIGK